MEERETKTEDRDRDRKRQRDRVAGLQRQKQRKESQRFSELENTERGRVSQTKAKGELRRPGKQGLAEGTAEEGEGGPGRAEAQK